MLLAALLSLILMVTCTFIHYEVLYHLNAYLPRMRMMSPKPKVMLAILGAMFSHLWHIALFATAFFLLRDSFGLGGFAGQFADVFSSYLYFSTETYTSLGFGDIYPLGQLRMVAGVEALTGLLMISWTASYTYLEMSRFWKHP